MTRSGNVIREIAFRSFISILFCTLFGYIFWKGSVLNRHHTASEYIVFGGIGSVFFQSLRYNPRNAFAALFVLSLTVPVVIMRETGVYFVRDVLVAIASGSALYLYFSNFYDREKSRKFTEPLVLAVLFAVCNFAVFLSLVLIEGREKMITLFWAYEVIKQWFLIGLGIGIGIILTERPYAERIRLWFLGFLGRAA